MAGERLKLAVWAALLAAGIVLSFGRGEVPVREAAAVVPTADGVAPDLALYAEVINEVRTGRNYYDVAREKIPQYGFPIASPLNWRLPTYAWLLSRLPNKCWIQAALLLLGVGGMWLTFVAQRALAVGWDKAAKQPTAHRILPEKRWVGTRPEASLTHPTVIAGATTFLMFGVVRWTFDGLAYLAQEPWAAVLIVISLGAGALARRGRESLAVENNSEMENGLPPKTPDPVWVVVSIAAGIAALLFRELALPYCLAAGGMAAWKRRWGEAVTWGLGITMFFGLFAWHVVQVKAQSAGMDVGTGGGGLAQWLRFGGLDFVLLTTRMNSLLFGAPAWLLWLYVLVALLGLGRGRDETSQVACGAALLYILAFAIVGRPENFYWGLLPAPLLVWGVARGVEAIGALLGKPAVASRGEGVPGLAG